MIQFKIKKITLNEGQNYLIKITQPLLQDPQVKGAIKNASRLTGSSSFDERIYQPIEDLFL